jgi:hypothetical protein
MNRDQIDAVLDSVRSWPETDREELAAYAREIEARRTGVYILSDDERRALAEAQQSPLVSEEEADRFWRQRGIE